MSPKWMLKVLPSFFMARKISPLFQNGWDCPGAELKSVSPVQAKLMSRSWSGAGAVRKVPRWLRPRPW